MTQDQFKGLYARVMANIRNTSYKGYFCIGSPDTDYPELTYLYGLTPEYVYGITSQGLEAGFYGTAHGSEYYIRCEFWKDLCDKFVSIDVQIEQLDDEIKQKCTTQLNLEKEIEELRCEVSELLEQKRKEKTQKMVNNLNIGQRFRHIDYQTEYILAAAGPGGYYILVNLKTGQRFTNPTTFIVEAFGSDIFEFEPISQ